MSDSPYFTKKDALIYKDAGRYYLDYLQKEGIKKENPKHYEEAHQAYLRMCDWVQFWARYPGIGDTVQAKKPQNALERNILA
jgi:hypothetical protein